MPRKYIRKTNSNYSNDDINHALADIKNKKVIVPRDAPVPVPDWVTGYPARQGDRSDWYPVTQSETRTGASLEMFSSQRHRRRATVKNRTVIIMEDRNRYMDHSLISSFIILSQ